MDNRQNYRDNILNPNMDIPDKVESIEFNPLGEGNKYIATCQTRKDCGLYEFKRIEKGYIDIESLLKDNKELLGKHLNFKCVVYDNEPDNDMTGILDHPNNPFYDPDNYEYNSLGDILDE